MDRLDGNLRCVLLSVVSHLRFHLESSLISGYMIVVARNNVESDVLDVRVVLRIEGQLLPLWFYSSAQSGRDKLVFGRVCVSVKTEVDRLIFQSSFLMSRKFCTLLTN